MGRSPTSRWAALGLLVLLQVSAVAHLEHLGCFVASGTESDVADPGMGMASPSTHQTHAAPSHHGGAQRPGGGDDSDDRSCCLGTCVCPQVQVELNPGALLAAPVAAITRAGLPSAPSEPRLAPTPHLLPLPNPPPVA